MVELLTLQKIREAVQNEPVEARVHVQLETVASKLTREGKPYCELTLADAGDRMALRVWSDHPNYPACDSMQSGDFVEIAGEFYQHQQYGLDVRRWATRRLTAEEQSQLLQGPAELRARQTADWKFIVETTSAIRDPRLHSLCAEFIDSNMAHEFNVPGRRPHLSSRAPWYGLVEQLTAQMMRVAQAIAPLYPSLNLDLLIGGILFHDAGKLWENYLPESGFSMPFDELGEMVGHIGIGMEIVNSLWRKILSEEGARSWPELRPASDDVRLHLLHLIAAHHGEKQLGSPVFPKTPEAAVLHYIDNLDARLEMFFAGYPIAKPGSRIASLKAMHRPLPGNLVKALEKFEQPSTEDGDRLF